MENLQSWLQKPDIFDFVWHFRMRNFNWNRTCWLILFLMQLLRLSVAEDCLVPSLEHGEVRGTGNSRSWTGRLSCSPGYSLLGSSTLKCREGQWSSTVPVCTGQSVSVSQRYQSENLPGIQIQIQMTITHRQKLKTQEMFIKYHVCLIIKTRKMKAQNTPIVIWIFIRIWMSTYLGFRPPCHWMS